MNYHEISQGSNLLGGLAWQWIEHDTSVEAGAPWWQRYFWEYEQAAIYEQGVPHQGIKVRVGGGTGYPFMGLLKASSAPWPGAIDPSGDPGVYGRIVGVGSPRVDDNVAYYTPHTAAYNILASDGNQVILMSSSFSITAANVQVGVYISDTKVQPIIWYGATDTTFSQYGYGVSSGNWTIAGVVFSGSDIILGIRSDVTHYQSYGGAYVNSGYKPTGWIEILVDTPDTGVAKLTNYIDVEFDFDEVQEHYSSVPPGAPIPVYRPLQVQSVAPYFDLDGNWWWASFGDEQTCSSSNLGGCDLTGTSTFTGRIRCAVDKAACQSPSPTVVANYSSWNWSHYAHDAYEPPEVPSPCEDGFGPRIYSTAFTKPGFVHGLAPVANASGAWMSGVGTGMGIVVYDGGDPHLVSGGDIIDIHSTPIYSCPGDLVNGLGFFAGMPAAAYTGLDRSSHQSRTTGAHFAAVFIMQAGTPTGTWDWGVAGAIDSGPEHHALGDTDYRTGWLSNDTFLSSYSDDLGANTSHVFKREYSDLDSFVETKILVPDTKVDYAPYRTIDTQIGVTGSDFSCWVIVPLDWETDDNTLIPLKKEYTRGWKGWVIPESPTLLTWEPVYPYLEKPQYQRFSPISGPRLRPREGNNSEYTPLGGTGGYITAEIDEYVAGARPAVAIYVNTFCDGAGSDMAWDDTGQYTTLTMTVRGYGTRAADAEHEFRVFVQSDSLDEGECTLAGVHTTGSADDVEVDLTSSTFSLRKGTWTRFWLVVCGPPVTRVSNVVRASQCFLGQVSFAATGPGGSWAWDLAGEHLRGDANPLFTPLVTVGASGASGSVLAAF